MGLLPEIPRVNDYQGDCTKMPEWVKEGESVAVVTWNRGESAVRFHNVTRVTAKFVTVDDGTQDGMKFSLVKGLERAGERDAYGPKYFLADPNDDATKFARSLYRLNNLASHASIAANNFARKQTRENAEAAAKAFRAWVTCDENLQRAQELWMEQNPRHNHFTRDIKAPGSCPACDAYHARESQ